MQKLKSFDQFATEAKISQTRKLEEEKVTKRTNEAETFKALLAEFKVTSIKELTKEQRSQFFNKLRGAELNESLTLIEEGTRGQFGKIDKRGNITSVYTHYDSYPENMLPIIKKSFDKGQNVDDVLAKGDNSGLDTDVDSINFYGGKVRPTTGSITNISKYLKGVADKGGAEFVYLWDEGNKQWLMADLYGNGFDELVPAFESLSVSVVLCEATVEMDAMDPDDKDFLKFLKKHKVEIIDKKMDGPSGGHPVITMQGKRKDLEAVLADEELGWADAGLAEYIEESVVTEAEVNSDEEFNEYATTVLQKAFGEEYDEAKAKQVVDGILAKAKGDYGVAVGMLTSSLG